MGGRPGRDHLRSHSESRIGTGSNATCSLICCHDALQVVTPVFSAGSTEDFTITMGAAWCDIISAFTADAQLARKPRVRATALNPIQYTIGNHSVEKARVRPPAPKQLIQAGPISYTQ